MQGILLRSYRKLSKNGQPVTVFVYTVRGTESELEQFKDSQGANYRESDDGEPLWFTTKVAGKSCNLIFTSKGTVSADMSAYDQAHSLAAQYGGSLGAELAKRASEMLLGHTPPPPSGEQTPAKEQESPKKGDKPDLTK